MTHKHAHTCTQERGGREKERKGAVSTGKIFIDLSFILWKKGAWCSMSIYRSLKMISSQVILQNQVMHI